MDVHPTRILLPALLVGAALFPACRSDTPTAPGAAARAVLTLTVQPNPIVADPIPGGFQIRYTITVTETAGVGGQFEFVNSTLFDDVTGSQVAVNNFDNKDLIVFVGSDRLNPGARIDVPQTIAYVTPGGGKAALLTVAVRFKDDKSNLISGSILVRIV